MNLPDVGPAGDADTSSIDGWDADRLASDDRWRFTFDDDAAAEVRAHLVRHGGIDPTLHAVEFPALEELARQIRYELAHGYGLAWLRPAEDLGTSPLGSEEYRALFSIVTSLMGMAHRVLSTAEPDPSEFSTEPGSWPAELATAMVDGLVPDVVGALQLDHDPDPSEGAIHAVSGKAVHRELENQESGLVRLLYRPVIQKKGDPVPVFRYERTSRSLEWRYSRKRILAAHEYEAVPVSASLEHALDVMAKAMDLPHLVTAIGPMRGDIILVNNKSVATMGLFDRSSHGHGRQVRIMRVVNPLSSQAESSVD